MEQLLSFQQQQQHLNNPHHPHPHPVLPLIQQQKPLGVSLVGGGGGGSGTGGGGGISVVGVGGGVMDRIKNTLLNNRVKIMRMCDYFAVSAPMIAFRALPLDRHRDIKLAAGGSAADGKLANNAR